MNRKKENTRISRYLSMILRHKPHLASIQLDKNGWANVDELLEGIKPKYKITKERLEEIVREDNKQRYSFNDKKDKIRANQGHSIPVDVELVEMIPPDPLWHGTGEKSLNGILSKGIQPMSRLYVHLSKDIPAAVEVGKRHGRPVVLRIDTRRMIQDGYKFYQSKNGVWLTKTVPTQYLKIEERN